MSLRASLWLADIDSKVHPRYLSKVAWSRQVFDGNWDFLVKTGPLLHEKSPFQTCECKKVIKLIGSVFVYELIDQINIEKVKFECL